MTPSGPPGDGPRRLERVGGNGHHDKGSAQGASNLARTVLFLQGE